MKKLDKLSNLTTLTPEDTSQINGGGFAHDVGTALRFAWIYGTEGYGSAVADYAVNQVKCN